MISICRRLLAGGGAGLALLALLVAAAPASANSGPTHSGQSYAVGLAGVKVLGSLVSVGDTTLPADSKLAPQGGSARGTVGTITLPSGLGSVVVARAEVQGDNDQSNAQSEVASATLLPAGVPAGVQLPIQVPTGVAVLSARLLTASAAVDCSGNVQADSAVASLSILGKPVDVQSGRNNVIEVPVGSQVAARVRTNVQDSMVGRSTVWGSISALEVEFPADGPLATLVQGTVTLSHAEADVHGCSATGGGSTPSPSPSTSPGVGGGAVPDQPKMPATGVPSDLAAASSPMDRFAAIDRFIELFFSRFTRS